MEGGQWRSKKQMFFAIIIGLFLFVLVCSAPLWRGRVFGYDQSIAHPNIARLAALLYNKTYPGKKLTVEEINWIMVGAEEEDTPTRWLNHFYDPIHNLGLQFEKRHLSAKDWATNPIAQTDFALGDQSWPRALADYNDGYREQAFKELGHVLHLIADTSVPAHTRLDIHVLPGDSYEGYVKQNWDEIQKRIDPQFIPVFSLNQAFDDVANYSNNNFYSDDTIESKDYRNINIEYHKIFTDINNKPWLVNIIRKDDDEIILFVSDNISDWNTFGGNKTLSLPIVLSNYSLPLLPKAIGTSAGVIKLFFDEAEKTAPADLPQNRISLWGWGNSLLGWGINAAEDVKDYLVGLFGGNNQAVGQGAATVSPVVVVPSEGSLKGVTEGISPLATLGRNDSETLDSRFHGNDNLEKVLGEKVVASVNVKDESDRDFSSPSAPRNDSEGAGSLKDGTEGISPLATLGRNDNEVNSGGGGGNNSSSGDGSSSGAPALDSLFQGDNSTTSTNPGADPCATAEASCDTPSTTPQDDNANTTSTPPFDGDMGTTTSTTATSTDPGADPCAFAEASCGTGSVPPQDDNVATSTSSIDNIPPTVPIITLEDVDITLGYNLTITVTSTDASSSLVWFDLEYLPSSPSSTPSSTWQILAASSTDAIYNFNAEPGQEYTWRARAEDGSGNISAWTPENLYKSKAVWGQQVVINEVAWAGTSSSSARYVNDKWLELYNNTDQDINITGWKLYVGNIAVSPVKITTTTIAAHGYYLMERSSGSSWNSSSSDDTVSDIPGDYIFYLDSSKFKLTGERLRLTDASGKIIDEVDCGSGWFTNNNDGLSRTMERINSRKSGSDPKNWQSSHGPRPVGRGRDGVTIYGSARQPNFGNIVLSGTLVDETRTITAVDNPFILSTYYVPFGKTLIIEPGVVIKARYPNSTMHVNGSLEIKGTTATPVVITSGRDQSFETPQLNTIFGTWPVGSAQARDWQGLWFYPESNGEIRGLDLRYTGYKFKSPREDHWFGSIVEQSIRVDHAVVNISDSNILNNGNVALYLENATTTIQNTDFDNGDRAINALNSFVSLNNVKMSNFSNAKGPTDIIRSIFPTINNLQLENNQFNGVHLENPVFSGDTTLGKELAWSMIYPRILSGGTLRLNPGAKLLLPHQGRIEVDGGSLLAIGTPDEPVEIAPLIANDTWGIIHFNNSDSILENVRLTNGNNTTNSDEGVITISNSRLKMKNVLMNHLRGAHNIIKSEESNLDLDTVNVGFDDKPGTETTGIDIKNGTLKLRSVKFKNLNFGMFALTSSIPDLDMDPIEALDPATFENVDTWILPFYPLWLKLPPLPELPL